MLHEIETVPAVDRPGERTSCFGCGETTGVGEGAGRSGDDHSPEFNVRATRRIETIAAGVGLHELGHLFDVATYLGSGVGFPQVRADLGDEFVESRHQAMPVWVTTASGFSGASS